MVILPKGRVYITIYTEKWRKGLFDSLPESLVANSIPLTPFSDQFIVFVHNSSTSQIEITVNTTGTTY